MNLTLTSLSPCKMHLTWEFTPEEVNEGLDQVEDGIRAELKRLSQKTPDWKRGPKGKPPAKTDKDNGIPAAFKGFRPHAVSRELLWKQMAGDIRKRYIDKILPGLWKSAVEENGFRPLGKPRFDVVDVNRDSAMKIVAEMDIIPKITLCPEQYHDLLVEIPVREEIGDQVITESLEQYRRQRVVFRAACEEDGADEGDLVTLRGQEKPFGMDDDAWTPEHSMQIQLGAGNFQPILQQMLVGMKAGEVRQYVQDVNGQPMDVHITVDDLKKRELPSLEDLAIQERCTSIEEMRAEVRDKLEKNAVLLYRANLRRSLMAALIGRLEVPLVLPEIIIRERFDMLWREASMTAMRQGRTMEQNEENKRSLWQLADRLAKEEMVLDEIVQMESLSVEPDEEEIEIYRIAERGGELGETVREWAMRDGKIELIRRQILWNKALQLMTGWARVQETIRLEVGSIA